MLKAGAHQRGGQAEGREAGNAPHTDTLTHTHAHSCKNSCQIGVWGMEKFVPSAKGNSCICELGGEKSSQEGAPSRRGGGVAWGRCLLGVTVRFWR